MSESWRVHPAGNPLSGRQRVPGDKSVGHRSLLFGALCDGVCEVSGLSGGEDNRSTARALRALGVRIEEHAGGKATIHGVGLRGLRAPSEPLDCGNSGTTMRLLAGLLAAQPFASTLVGDETLMRRPMRRVIEPLRAMGARIDGSPGKKPGELYPPLIVRGVEPRRPLLGVAHDSAIASAQVKSALVLAALYARGTSELREPGPSRDHTERMLAALGAPVSRPGHGRVRVAPDGWDGKLRPTSFVVPGDPSSSAFLVAAALLAPGSGEVTVEGVCVNPTRTGFLDALAAMGARIDRTNERDEGGEPVADLVVRGGEPLRGADLGGDLVVRAIDEIPVLAVVAARAAGRTTVRDAEELRVKESDRVATTVRMLRSFGVTAEERPDGLVIEGRPDVPLAPGDVDSAGDHRIAMSAAVAALVASGPSTVRDVANVATSFPTFRSIVGALGVRIEDAPSTPE